VSAAGGLASLNVGIAAFVMRAADALQLPFVDLLYGDLSPMATKTRFGIAFIAMTLGFALVTALVLVDPLLVWSVGFWLSVGATAGVSTVGPWLADRCAGLGPLALPFGVTLGAQVGVVVPSVLVFGRLPLVSIPANLLAVPVAGFVMLYGLPAGLLAGWVPVLGPLLMLPARFGTRWVDTIAMLGARFEPEAPWSWFGWAVVAAAVAAVAARGRRRDKNRPLGDASADR